MNKAYRNFGIMCACVLALVGCGKTTTTKKTTTTTNPTSTTTNPTSTTTKSTTTTTTIKIPVK